MVVDFSALDFKERPTLVLRNMDGTPIQPLAYAFDVKAKLMYNEVSELSFELPAYVDGKKTPHYDDVVGMRIVDWIGIGQFILVNPSRKNDGVSEIKSCTAYSLEYELNYKKIYISEGTYNLWNPVAPEGTVIGMILEDMPSWHASVDESLWGVYRTFESDNQTVYDLIKSTIQDKFQCIFDFDTYSRTMYVKAISSLVETSQVYISPDNLAKEITIKEDTENIFTCLDVNGADGVDILSVNPIGTNKIYNLDYFMNTTYFDQDLIDRWTAWKETYSANQKPYFNLTVEKVLQEARLATEQAALTTLNGELSTLETMQSTYAAYDAQGGDASEELATVKASITAKKSEITAKEALIKAIQDKIDAMYTQQKEINAKCHFKTAKNKDGNPLFSESELQMIDRYVKSDAIQEESFVYQTVTSYKDSDVAQSDVTLTIAFKDGSVLKTPLSSGDILYGIQGGSVTITFKGTEADSPDVTLTAKVKRADLEHQADGDVVFSALLNSGTYGEAEFPSGCVSVFGTLSSLTSDIKNDADLGDAYQTGTVLTVELTKSNTYFTKNATEYEKRAVEWDLMEYGQEKLEDLAWPTYTFTVDSSNFLAVDEFMLFKNQLSLGSKVYLHIGEDKILSPIAIGVEVNCDDPSDFNLLFGDKYSAKDSAFQLVDLLEQSISMGKSVASSKTNYNSFISSGASTQVKEYMKGALDASVQAVLAGKGQAIQIDGSGIRLRKLVDGSETEYDKDQIWMINNNIVFTDNNWDTAKMAIGHFKDSNVTDENGNPIDLWGIVAPSVVGTLLAGQNLVIESAKKSGDVAVFRVDAEGARLYNSRFDLVNDLSSGNNGQISLIPDIGLVGGVSTVSKPMINTVDNVTGIALSDGSVVHDLSSIAKDNLPNASFCLDMMGNAYFKGTVYATDGEFSGTVHATDGDFSGKIKAATLEGTLLGANGGEIKGVSLGIGGTNYDNFVVDSDGNVTMNGNIVLNGSISWSSSPVQYQFSVDGKTNWHTIMTANDMYRRDSLDGGKTWGEPYQFRGVNGKDGQNGEDGSDATVPTYITETVIDRYTIMAPNVYGTNFSIYPEDSSSTRGSFSIYGNAEGSQECFYQVSYQYPGYPVIMIDSPAGGSIEYYGGHVFQSGSTVSFVDEVSFSGKVDFTSASVTGIDTVAKFG